MTLEELKKTSSMPRCQSVTCRVPANRRGHRMRSNTLMMDERTSAISCVLPRACNRAIERERATSRPTEEGPITGISASSEPALRGGSSETALSEKNAAEGAPAGYYTGTSFPTQGWVQPCRWDGAILGKIATPTNSRTKLTGCVETGPATSFR